MKYLLIIISTFFFGANLQASHIIGGDMYYDCLGGNTYRVTLRIYRDCLSDGADFDPNLPVTVFNGSNVQIDEFSIPFPGSNTLDLAFDNPCITTPSDVCVEEAIYEQIVDLPPSANGYVLSYQRCCRGPAVTNLFEPEDQGLTLQVDIPATAEAICNNSARFLTYPPLVICAGQELVFDHSAVDPDGDDLVYELCAPYQGGTSAAPAPSPASPPPYTPVVWAAGTSADDPFGLGELNIDPVTGELVAEPEVPGLYAIGVCVKEYRAGVLISTSRRDFLFKVLNCDIELEADIVEQEDLPTFVSFCQGLEIQFVNTSVGEDLFYQWDFGVPEITSDVSTEFEPTYTFPTAGSFDVMLIVNPGWSCTDTAIATFIVEDEIIADFTPPDPQCIVDNSYDFMGEGIYPTPAEGVTFEWDFGEFSDPLISTDENPTGIEFLTPGNHEVTFTVNYEICSVSHTDEIFVFAEPYINFGVSDELKCAPYLAEFVDLSFAHTPIFYDWDFGVGEGGSTLQHPEHLYEEVGVYDVTLTIRTDSGCVDTLTLFRENLIETFPSPTAAFTVSPEEQDEYHADFFFTDFSIDGVEQWFHFGDGDFSSSPEVWHNYKDPGVYLPFQIVENEFGCRDQVYGKLTVTPVIPVIVPNAFTPDGNSVNNIFKPIFYEPIPFQLYIYDRWGELIYESNVKDGYWDGAYQNGKLAQDGVYIWKIVYNAFDTGLPVELGGHVLLIK